MIEVKVPRYYNDTLPPVGSIPPGHGLVILAAFQLHFVLP